jgi:hypothetical protein
MQEDHDVLGATRSSVEEAYTPGLHPDRFIQVATWNLLRGSTTHFKGPGEATEQVICQSVVTLVVGQGRDGQRTY